MNKKYNRRVFWFVISGALVLFFVIDRVAGYGLSLLAERSSIRFSRLYKGGINAEVLMVGDSRGVNCMYAPDVKKYLGVDGFNLSWNSENCRISTILIKDYLERNSAPKLIIFEITNINVPPELLPSISFFSSKSKGLDLMLKMEKNLFWRFSKFSHLLQFNSEFYLRCLYYIGRDDQQWINNHVLTPEYFQELVVKKDYQIFLDPDPEKLIELQQLAEELESRGIQIRFIVSPFLPEWIANNPEFHDWLGQIRDGLGEHRVFDYHNSLHGLEYFADAVHINRTGADLLLQTMIQDGFFESLQQDDDIIESLSDHPEVEMR